MNIDYVIWGSSEIENTCFLYELLGVEEPQELNEGFQLQEKFPSNVRFSMDPDQPYDMLLSDNLRNSNMLIIASERVKKFLADRNLQRIEYLPVSIINHKNRPIETKYFIIHTIDPVDCLDFEKSESTWSDIDTTCIDKIKQLVLHEDRIENFRDVFRLKFFYDVTLIRRELAENMDKEGFTGNQWIELDDYLKEET